VRRRSLALPSRVRHSTLTEITTAGCPTRANHRGLGRFQPLPRPGHRTVAGLAAARARGRNGGRPSKLSPGQVRVARRLYDEREHTVEQMGSIFGVSRTSVYRALRDKPIDAKPVGTGGGEGRRGSRLTAAPKTMT